MQLIKVLGLNAKEASFAVRSFIAKVVLFWLAELLICKLDQESVICTVVEKGFFPCLLSFADPPPGSFREYDADCRDDPGGGSAYVDGNA